MGGYPDLHNYLLGGAAFMNPLAPLAFIVFALALSGCGKPQTRKPPVPFEITALEIARDPQYTNLMTVSGAVSVRGDALKGKGVLLLLNAKVSFKSSGITKTNVIVPVFVTNGSAALT